MGLGLYCCQIGNKMSYIKSWKNLYRKKKSMLTGLKVSPLAFKCLFYRPEHKAKGGPH